MLNKSKTVSWFSKQYKYFKAVLLDRSRAVSSFFEQDKLFKVVLLVRSRAVSLFSEQFKSCNAEFVDRSKAVSRFWEQDKLIKAVQSFRFREVRLESQLEFVQLRYTEDGEGISRCSVCGYESALHPISKKGHDFSYEYHKQIKIWGNWETNYDYITEHAWESRGEGTATCKTCGERFEEIGFNTGVEQKDGTRAEVWGVEERPAAVILFGEINNYRASTYSSQGSYLKPLERSKALDQYALFRAAQAAARCLRSDAVGVVAVNDWSHSAPGATMACGAECAGQGSKIDLYSFVQGTYSTDRVFEICRMCSLSLRNRERAVCRLSGDRGRSGRQGKNRL